MKKRDQFREQWEAILNRLGWRPKDRLAWAVRRVQENQRGMTPGEREDVRAELGVFATGVKGGGAAGSDEYIERPSPEEVAPILSELARILQAAVQRDPVTIARRVSELALHWDRGIKDGPYKRPARFYLGDQDDSYDDWRERAKRVLARLLVDEGHWLRECPAPEARGKKGETCGKWFVANRPRQMFCSPRCQTRAATRSYRDEQPKGKKHKRSRA